MSLSYILGYNCLSAAWEETMSKTPSTLARAKDYESFFG